MNKLSSFLFSLFALAAPALAQYTLPAGTLLMDAPAVKAIGHSSISCGSTVATEVNVITRETIIIPNFTPIFDPDAGSDILTILFADDVMANLNIGHYVEAWRPIAEVMAMRDFYCLPCLADLHQICMMSASGAVVWPPLSVTVVSAAQIGNNLWLTVDFVVKYNVWVTCDTRDGCR